ncbi:phosphate:acyl-[acyl carrier protein] acyltransferase [Aminivibrio pyruvatiphilus]|uniref:Phosphate acyltransferase n=1 Tax=Aminivibrio pyruvatiphilus TaxID=1005740 RepID=A0A4V3HGL7_9BACT|nr:phosphate acyltransferase PlsX [Aminivibrio pyruvatiphilus]TDY61791.1 phosphate:acyl-[acyl carrier protein] acyltransferase [Aminivibrio pyruvatiphilus]
MILALDAMGGDHGPSEVCRGAISACEEHPDLELVLVGQSSDIEPLLAGVSRDVSGRISIVHAEERIGMDEHPTVAIRKKRRSSLRVAMEMVRSGEASGCVSAGNTGAIVAGGVLVVGRIAGIDRPALGVALPTLNKYTFLLDVGATVRSKPENLFQFAHMGNVYSKKILGVSEPQVALLANGSEEIKGDEVIAGAKTLIKASGLNFSGYVEGDDIPYSRADVVVCDGFSGNVVLKFAEGLMSAVYSILKEEMGHRIMPKFGMVFMIPMMKDLWARFNYEKHGGTPLLGVNGIVVKAHGRSKAPAITNALRVARNFVLQNGVELIREELG